jgi:3D (Asp-Asp-Asp) domain-containing protein
MTMSKSVNRLVTVATLVVFVAIAITGYFVWESHAVHNTLDTVRTNLSATLEELGDVESQLVRTQEQLQAEILKSTDLKNSLDSAYKEIENAGAEILRITSMLSDAHADINELKSDEYKLVYVGNFYITYYCDERYSHICGGSGLTASGKPTEVGWSAAADWSVLPKGSVVYIEGLGFREIQDVGGGVDGRHIDVLVATHDEALRLGTTSSGAWILVKKNP